MTDITARNECSRKTVLLEDRISASDEREILKAVKMPLDVKCSYWTEFTQYRELSQPPDLLVSPHNCCEIKIQN